MSRNVGPEDRTVRVVVGLALAVVIYLGYIHDWAAIVVGILAAYLVITGLLGRCILYKAIDVDTAVQEQPYSSTDDRAGL
jgi:hypothetical protein